MSKQVVNTDPNGNRPTVRDVCPDTGAVIAKARPILERLEREGACRRALIVCMVGGSKDKPEKTLARHIAINSRSHSHWLDPEGYARDDRAGSTDLSGCRVWSHSRIGGRTFAVCTIPDICRPHFLALTYITGFLDCPVVGMGPAGQIGKAQRAGKAPKAKGQSPVSATMHESHGIARKEANIVPRVSVDGILPYVDDGLFPVGYDEFSVTYPFAALGTFTSTIMGMTEQEQGTGI